MSVRVRMVILNNTREKEISILIVIADPGILIRIIQSFFVYFIYILNIVHYLDNKVFNYH